MMLSPNRADSFTALHSSAHPSLAESSTSSSTKRTVAATYCLMMQVQDFCHFVCFPYFHRGESDSLSRSPRPQKVVAHKYSSQRAGARARSSPHASDRTICPIWIAVRPSRHVVICCSTAQQKYADTVDMTHRGVIHSSSCRSSKTRGREGGPADAARRIARSNICFQSRPCLPAEWYHGREDAQRRSDKVKGRSIINGDHKRRLPHLYWMLFVASVPPSVVVVAR
jgi:hypothetical protein